MMFEMVDEIGDKFAGAIDKELTLSGLIDMKQMLARFSTDVIASVAFGLDSNCESSFALLRTFDLQTFIRSQQSQIGVLRAGTKAVQLEASGAFKITFHFLISRSLAETSLDGKPQGALRFLAESFHGNYQTARARNRSAERLHPTFTQTQQNQLVNNPRNGS